MELRDRTSPGGVTITIESPRQDEVERLIEELDRFQGSLYPSESNHFLDLDGLDTPQVKFFVIRKNDVVVGCGALRVDETGYGEVKRMFVLPTVRGLGLGRLLLNRIIEQAQNEGLHCLRLETGVYQEAALTLYRAAGFVECGPFGTYAADPLSVFMERAIQTNENRC